MQWYQLRQVEYAADFTFFVNHQIAVCTMNGTRYFTSRLEPFCFREVPHLRHTLPEDELTIRDIHRRLLKGEYGQGTLIN